MLYFIYLFIPFFRSNIYTFSRFINTYFRFLTTKKGYFFWNLRWSHISIPSKITQFGLSFPIFFLSSLSFLFSLSFLSSLSFFIDSINAESISLNLLGGEIIIKIVLLAFLNWQFLFYLIYLLLIFHLFFQLFFYNLLEAFL